MEKRNSVRLVFVLFLTLILVIPSVAAAPGGGGGRKYYVNGYVKTNAGVPISGASVKLYIDGSYINTVTTQSNGYFSGSAYRYTTPRTWKAVASKTGYVTATKTVRCGTSSTTYMGIISLYPLQTQYHIHGYVKNIYYSTPVAEASVEIRLDGSYTTTVTTDQNGYYSYTYGTFDSLVNCWVIVNAPDYYENDKVVVITGPDVDMGLLELFHIGGWVTKYAVLVGIDDYLNGGDDPEVYEFTDSLYGGNDIDVWYYYLTTILAFQSENIWVYGDGHTDNYPKYDGDATEANVKSGLENMINIADINDVVCFIYSGHGGREYTQPDNRVFLGMYDYDVVAEEGCFRDSEIADIFEESVAATNFLFISACHSGGIGDNLELLDNYDNTLLLTACGWEGYGWDYPLDTVLKVSVPGGWDYVYPEEGLSLWTYWFLDQGLMDHFGYDPFTTMEEAYQWAFANYPQGEFQVEVYQVGVGTYYETVQMEDDWEPGEYDGTPNDTTL